MALEGGFVLWPAAQCLAEADGIVFFHVEVDVKISKRLYKDLLVSLSKIMEAN